MKVPYYGGSSHEEWLVWKDKLPKALDCQSIRAGPQRYSLTKKLLTGDTKATFNQAALDIGIHTVANITEMIMEMTKYAF